MSNPFVNQHQRPAFLQQPDPAQWLTIDIETGDAPEEAIHAAVENWKAPSNWRAETVDRKRTEWAEKAKEKAALLDASPVLCIAVKTNQQRLIFNGMGEQTPKLDGWPVIPCFEEPGLLLAFRIWMDGQTDGTSILVGHNILGFDLPKLRNAYIRHRLRLPKLMGAGVLDSEPLPPVSDTARLFRRFSMEHRDNEFPSLDLLARTLGLQRPKLLVSGADVPRLHREGRIAEILTYCAVDCATTAEAWLLMSGRASTLH